MIEINLLPHREARRAADLRQTVGVLVLGLLAQGAVVWQMNSSIQADLQKAQNAVRQIESDIEQYKPQEAKVAEFKQVRTQLEDKLAVIDGLDKGRTGPVRLMDEVSRHTPERLWLTRLETKGAKITVEGESLDTGMVADFLRGLNESLYFQNVDLDKTSRGKEIEGIKLVTFVITAELTRPDDEDETEAAAGA